MTWPALHISQSIDADTEAVIAVGGDPRMLPQWAAGLSAGIRNVGGRWITDSPMGAVEVTFVGPAASGVLDHDVTLPDGSVVHNPLRVLRNNHGSEVVFTLFKRTGVTDEEFDADADAVRSDLTRLKALVEDRHPMGKSKRSASE